MSVFDIYSYLRYTNNQPLIHSFKSTETSFTWLEIRRSEFIDGTERDFGFVCTFDRRHG